MRKKSKGRQGPSWRRATFTAGRTPAANTAEGMGGRHSRARGLSSYELERTQAGEKPSERSHECLLHRKEGKEEKVSKAIVWGLKKKNTNLECQRDAMLSIFIIGIYKYVHGDMYTSFYCHTWYFSIHVQ